jgi:hypothetical protein
MSWYDGGGDSSLAPGLAASTDEHVDAMPMRRPDNKQSDA